MATTTRVEIITRAKIRAGRSAQNLNLGNAFDGTLQYMSARYPLINNQRFYANSVDAQIYLAANLTGDTLVGATTAHAHNVTGSTPTLLRTVEKIQHNSVDLEYLEPEIFFTFYTATKGTPTKATLTWMATDTVTAIYSGNAAGSIIYMYPPPTGAVNTQLFATIISPKSGAVDSYQHVMGEEMDWAITLGVCWKALEIIGNFEEAVREKMRFERELKLKAMEHIKGAITVHQPDL